MSIILDSCYTLRPSLFSALYLHLPLCSEFAVWSLAFDFLEDPFYLSSWSTLHLTINIKFLI